MFKHDPSYKVQKSIKQLLVKSKQRLIAAKNRNPKYLHSRFNIETLTQSPLMGFPHFVEMTQFLIHWFEVKDLKFKSAITSTQKSTFEAQKKFSNSLFFFLQETAKASPISSKPLSGIYNWFLQKDTLIHQNRIINQNESDSQFLIIELLNGKEIRIDKKLLDLEHVFNLSSLNTANSLDLKNSPIKLRSKQEENPQEIKIQRKIQILTDSTLPGPAKKILDPVILSETFNFTEFHNEMEKNRKEERETELIALAARNKRKEEIKTLPAWQ